MLGDANSSVRREISDFHVGSIYTARNAATRFELWRNGALLESSNAERLAAHPVLVNCA